MALTPPANLPTRPRTVSCGRHRSKRKKKIKSKGSSNSRVLMVGVGSVFLWKTDPTPPCFPIHLHPRMAWIYCRHREIVGGGEGADGGTVHGMDAVAEPTGTYLRRVPPSAPSLPGKQQPRAALASAVAFA
ncbi:hypothetical protein FEO87_17100 [Stenotrophomonas maltophilia]|nr:hypothetical protein FEO87_17100 [Stenotrophomonas maltophilia]